MNKPRHLVETMQRSPTQRFHLEECYLVHMYMACNRECAALPNTMTRIINRYGVRGPLYEAMCFELPAWEAQFVQS
jgi:hypothetical protein